MIDTWGLWGLDIRTAGIEEYHGGHESPGPTTGFPVWDMTGTQGNQSDIGGVPEDWYTHPHYYSSGASDGGSAADMKATQNIYNKIRGNPEHPVDIYRALPHGNTKFNTGDWVTPSLNYARQHAMQSDDPAEDWPVIRSTVPAKHLFQNGDSYDEFGYHGPSHEGTIAGQPKQARRTMTAAVTLFTKPNCPQCTMTKNQLDKHGIPHDVVDVTTDPVAHDYVTGELGYSAAPVVHAGGDNHWSGFRPDRIKALAG